ncbi:MAG: hypothetical protein J1E56_02455 [Ruminococcus sp.]|nr:hypothetical protein [Ruminococcus sp.]
MKQLILFTGIILLTCVIVSSVVIPAKADNENIEMLTEVIEESQEDVYVLKNNEGMLCVYMKGEDKPVLNTDTNVSVLPKEDQKRLEEGIEVTGEKALHKALEDYCS